jgi:GWxTD domain-containing protein
MRIKGLAHCCLTIVLLLAASASLAAQEGQKGQTIVPMKGGFFVAFTTTPNANEASAGGWSRTFAEAYFESNTIRRVFIDSGGSLYFGYSLVVEPVASSKQFRVSVRPLSPEDEQELRARKSFQTRRIHPNYNSAALARAAAQQTIADGDTFALDVLVNPETGDKITDFVTVSQSESRLRETSTADSAPRDFTLEDVMLKMINYQLYINGEMVAGSKRSGATTGPVIWFHLTDRGRFIFSLKPHEGYDFKRLGTIENNRLKFTLNNERYEWVSDVPVVDTGGPWNLYVLHDPNYVPDSFFLGVRGAAAKPKSTNVYSSVAEAQRAMRTSKRSVASSLGNSSTSSSRKEETDDENEWPGTRLIIGAASRIENLLPKGTGHLSQEGLKKVYHKWLSEDVSYIITIEEARAFKMLKTDEQRETFIEQFWQRRDPDTSTKENEFRREYYGRIAYANENFSFNYVPGWRTDRGRIFITYGKPDAVEQFPSGERWIYKNIQGLGSNVAFEFVDVSGSGEYRLQKEKQ